MSAPTPVYYSFSADTDWKSLRTQAKHLVADDLEALRAKVGAYAEKHSLDVASFAYYVEHRNIARRLRTVYVWTKGMLLSGLLSSLITMMALLTGILLFAVAVITIFATHDLNENLFALSALAIGVGMLIPGIAAQREFGTNGKRTGRELF